MAQATLRPTTAGALSPSPTTPAETDALRRRHLDLREKIAAKAPNSPRGPAGRPARAERPVTLVEGRSAAAAVSLNVRNPVASSDAGTTVAEPAAANDGNHVLFTGNTYASFSTDGGTTWAQREIPAGPPDAPVPCCDQDVVHDRARQVTFWSILYLDESGVNGVVRIFVGTPSAARCSYVVDPGGTANDVIADYPHLAVGTNFLYLGTSNLRVGEWIGSQMRRFDLAQMARCQPASGQTFTYLGPGQRVFVPAEGTSSVAYWGALQTPTSFTVFRWPERAGAPSTVTRTISASTFENPDCRGGVDDGEFVERASAWNIAGFRLRGALGGGRLAFYWNVGSDAQHPQGHVHAAVFREGTLELLAQPHLYHPDVCIAYPAVASNARGEVGLSLAAGGRRGGNGPAARGWVGIGQPSPPGMTYTPFALTAQGSHNAIDGRWGDYFTVRSDSRCANAWVGTNYGLVGGNFLGAHVNARYVAFGPARGTRCAS